MVNVSERQWEDTNCSDIYSLNSHQYLGRKTSALRSHLLLIRAPASVMFLLHASPLATVHCSKPWTTTGGNADASLAAPLYLPLDTRWGRAVRELVTSFPPNTESTVLVLTSLAYPDKRFRSVLLSAEPSTKGKDLHPPVFAGYSAHYLCCISVCHLHNLSSRCGYPMSHQGTASPREVETPWSHKYEVTEPWFKPRVFNSRMFPS